MRKEVVGNCELYLADNAVILADSFPLGKIDAVVTDPPYGLGDKHNGGGGGKLSTWKHKSSVAKSFDMERPSRGIFESMLARADDAIIWGGNYFTDYLPPSMRWLVWDKGLEGFSTSDFEMAWTSQNQAARRFKYSCGNERGFAPKSKEDREFINSHPTQKPIEVMKWCLSFLPKAEIILDPFMGSGSTGVACVNMGKKFIGVEIDEKYFEISCKRIEQAQKQGRMAI